MGPNEHKEDELLRAVAALDSRDVLYALDGRDVKVWLCAMRDWRQAEDASLELDRSTARWACVRALYVGSRAVLLDVLCRMDIRSKDDLVRFLTGVAYTRDVGWHMPTEEEDEKRAARHHSDYLEDPDPLDANWIDERYAA